jgi:hypothetical protein
MEHRALGQLVAAAFIAGPLQVEQIPTQVGQPQGFLQLLLLDPQLFQHPLHLRQPMGEMAQGQGGEALVIGTEGLTCCGTGGDAQLRQQGQGLRAGRRGSGSYGWLRHGGLPTPGV